MSVLSDRLAGLRAENRPALVGYLPAGFPDLETSPKELTVSPSSFSPTFPARNRRRLAGARTPASPGT